MTFIITIISLLIGYYLGTKAQSFELIEEDGKKVLKRITNLLPKSDLKPGIYKRPNAQMLFDKNKPQDKKEADKAMVDTLDQIPELREAKEKLKGVI